MDTELKQSFPYRGLTPAVFEEQKAEAEKTFDVVQGTRRCLLLDLDTPEALAQFERVLPKVRDNFKVTQIERWASKSGNTHIMVMLGTSLYTPERIALQAALGSDGVREVLSMKRYENGVEQPSLLHRPRDAVVSVTE